MPDQPLPPLNDLERLLTKPKFGPQDHPELFRLLRESELVFLLPYHPEMEEATLSLQNGDRLPPFSTWSSPTDGQRIPVFSSIDRAQEACRKTGAHDKKFILCAMPGQQLFGLLACQDTAVALNPVTTIASILMDLNCVKEIAKPAPDRAAQDMKTGRVQPLTPTDYPTALIQSLFLYLRESPGVRAAWLTKELDRTGPGISYIVMVLGTGEQAKIRRDIILVADSGRAKGETLGVGFLDGNNAAIMALFAKFTPFYSAPDYQAASPLGPE